MRNIAVTGDAIGICAVRVQQISAVCVRPDPRAREVIRQENHGVRRCRLDHCFNRWQLLHCDSISLRNCAVPGEGKRDRLHLLRGIQRQSDALHRVDGQRSIIKSLHILAAGQCQGKGVIIAAGGMKQLHFRCDGCLHLPDGNGVVQNPFVEILRQRQALPLCGKRQAVELQKPLRLQKVLLIICYTVYIPADFQAHGVALTRSAEEGGGGLVDAVGQRQRPRAVGGIPIAVIRIIARDRAACARVRKRREDTEGSLV